MKMSGIFRFYQNGELIGEAENRLTEIGRILAIKTLSGAVPSFGTSIGVGTGDSENDVPSGSSLATNTRLDFRVATAPVIATNIDDKDQYDAIMFKAKITDPLFYKIYEVGLFADPLISGSTGYRDELILSFENTDNLFNPSAGTSGLYLSDDSYNSANAFFTSLGTGSAYDNNFRIGRKALVLTGFSGEIITTNGFNALDQYDDLDKLTLAFGAPSGSTTVTVKFYTNTAFRSYTFTGANTYNVVAKNLADGTNSGSFDWNNITKIGVSASGTAVLDGLKIENFNIFDTNRGMVSRAKLPNVLVKLANIPVDIEYTLRIGFNG